MLVMCAICTVFAILAWGDQASVAIGRLHAASNHGSVTRKPAETPPRIGISQMLAAVVARMKGGGTMIEAFEEQAGGHFAMRRLTMQRLIPIFEGIRLPDESRMQATRVAVSVAAASTVSEELGCRAVPCLEAALGVYRQMRLIQHLRSQAFAVPKATVGLLSALPAATVVLGELMGARPITFLFGSQQGLACLAVGGCCYVAGLIWIRALMREC